MVLFSDTLFVQTENTKRAYNEDQLRAYLILSEFFWQNAQLKVGHEISWFCNVDEN